MKVDSGHILVADNTPKILSILANTLTKAGYQLKVAIDSKSVIKQSLESFPDLLLLDVHMPQTDGFEVCAQLKNNPHTRDIPIILMMTSRDPANIVKGFRLGAADYITKPLQTEEVLARVNLHMELQALKQTLSEQSAELEATNQTLKEVATLDGITKIANRHSFDDSLSHEWKRLAREHKPLSLILCDVDCFKQYNDRYGPLEGNACLKKVAQAVKRSVRRPADLVARYGGDKLAVLLPDTDTWGAVQVAKNIQSKIRSLQINHETSEVSDQITLSLGIASIAPAHGVIPKLLIARTDEALYQAKRKERNNFSISPPLIESLIHKSRLG